MEAYEFYSYNPLKGHELLGVLPERRRNSERITQKSVMNWGAKLFGGNLSTKNIYFIQVTINEHTGMIHRPAPAFVPQK
jgi:hypothetical protein